MNKIDIVAASQMALNLGMPTVARLISEQRFMSALDFIIGDIYTEKGAKRKAELCGLRDSVQSLRAKIFS